MALRWARGVGWVLLLASLLKVVALVSGSRLLDQPHPWVPVVMTWQLVVVAAGIEGVAGLAALLSRHPALALGWPTGCLGLLAGYRACMAWAGIEAPCACLGPMAGWLGWSAGVERLVTLAVLGACMASLGLAWWMHGRASSGPEAPVPSNPGTATPDKQQVIPAGRGGFSLLELLLLLAIAGVLMALFLPAIAKARSLGRSAGCLGQVRQMGLAMELYAGDHQDSFPPNLDGPDVPVGQTWMQGWLGWAGPDCTNLTYLRTSLLAPYIKDIAVWKCPATGPVESRGVRVTKVRSFSINGFVGSPVVSPVAATFRKRSDLGPMSPSRLLGFVEERPETINDGSFGMQWDFDAARPADWMLRDQPAVHHGMSGNLAWVDGHAETHRWRDFPRVVTNRLDHPAPGHRDVLWLQQNGTWRGQGLSQAREDGR